MAAETRLFMFLLFLSTHLHECCRPLHIVCPPYSLFHPFLFFSHFFRSFYFNVPSFSRFLRSLLVLPPPLVYISCLPPVLSPSSLPLFFFSFSLHSYSLLSLQYFFRPLPHLAPGCRSRWSHTLEQLGLWEVFPFQRFLRIWNMSVGSDIIISLIKLSLINWWINTSLTSGIISSKHWSCKILRTFSIFAGDYTQI